MILEVDKVTNTVKLERYYNSILLLEKKISSYVYEPTTYSLYERKEYLLEKIDNLLITFSNQMNFLKEKDVFVLKEHKELADCLDEIQDVLDMGDAYTASFS